MIAACSATPFSAVLAQSDAAEAAAPTVSATVEEIVVTSQRREQSLQEVPLAVTALTAASLERSQVTTTTGLIRMVPNLSGGESSGSGANNYSLRGLYNAESSATFDSPVGTYIDGVFVARMNANNFSLFDVERIEVLRGPQGTLFGRNTTGGAISIVLKRPSEELEGYFEAGLGNYNQWQLRGGVNVPISDRLRARVSAYRVDEDGWVENRTLGGTNNGRDGRGVRAALTYDISPSTVWNLAVDYIDERKANIPAKKVNGTWVSNSGLRPLDNLVVGRKGNVPANFVGNETWSMTSNLAVDLAFGQLELITGYRDLTTQFSVDYFDNPSTIGGYVANQYSSHKQFSQEVKLTGDLFDRLSYTTGLYYFLEENDTDQATSFRLGSGAALIEFDDRVLNDTEALAAYGQLDYLATDRLTLTAGLRLTRETKDVSFRDNGNPLASATITDQLLINAGIPLEQTETVLTPRFAAQYQINGDVMLFASATRGFKSGGWNVRGTSAATLQNFSPEKIWSYELGFRSDLFARRLRLNATAFYGDTSDLQIATAYVTGGGTPAFPVGNYADFESYGLEIDALAILTDRLRMTVALGYNETSYKGLSDAVLAQQSACLQSIASGATSRPNCAAGIITADGQIADPARAPKYTALVGFDYSVSILGGWELMPSISARYTGSYNTNAAQIRAGRDNGYTLISAGVALESPDGKLNVSAGCENCTNQSYLLTTIGGHNWWNEPARWFLRTRVSF